ncbi:unnamed protein product [Linum tenue]|uniref:Uncharacterized protein n=1 Tax=Linum tenue TaxID=586396 RepID=A0AAV0H7R0_9ROSI|nr:unnamed protein product [Linum tenue]
MMLMSCVLNGLLYLADVVCIYAVCAVCPFVARNLRYFIPGRSVKFLKCYYQYQRKQVLEVTCTLRIFLNFQLIVNKDHKSVGKAKNYRHLLDDGTSNLGSAVPGYLVWPGAVVVKLGCASKWLNSSTIDLKVFSTVAPGFALIGNAECRQESVAASAWGLVFRL